MCIRDSPSDVQLKKLLSLPPDAPVVALNLFQFNSQAQYQPSDPEFNTEAANVTGKIAWARYSATAGKYLADLGGKVVFSTPVAQVMIGPADVQWDVAAIMYFPTRKAFMEMLENPVFQKASRHRKAALANHHMICLLYTSPSPRDATLSRMPSSA